MKRLSLLIALLAACASPAVAAVVAPPSPAPPRASLSTFVCQRALDPPDRGISVRSVMRPVSGTGRLEVRFQLLRTRPGATTFVHGGDLGRWISPADPTLGHRPGDVWELTKSVADLSAPATYRFRVSFRWIGANARVLDDAVRSTRDCRQPELRPDLLVRAITVEPAPSGSGEAYVARIENRGASASGPFAVLFRSADGSVTKRRKLGSLAAHASTRVRFVGPGCGSGGGPTITADPDGVVDDRERSNNSLTAACAPSQATSAPLH